MLCLFKYSLIDKIDCCDGKGSNPKIFLLNSITLTKAI